MFASTNSIVMSVPRCGKGEMGEMSEMGEMGEMDEMGEMGEMGEIAMVEFSIAVGVCRSVHRQ